MPPQTWLETAGPCGPMVRCNKNGALPHGTVLACGTGTILACRATGTILACRTVSRNAGLRFSFGIKSHAMGWWRMVADGGGWRRMVADGGGWWRMVARAIVK